MYKRALIVSLLLIMGLVLNGCSGDNDKVAQKKQRILVYCDNALVKPLAKVVQVFEKETGIKVAINPGTASKLYEDVKAVPQGELFLANSVDFYDQVAEDKLFGEQVVVAYNQAAFIVKRGNPKKVSDQISELLRDDIKIAISNPKTTSIGKETKAILDKREIYLQVFENMVYLAEQADQLNQVLLSGEADLVFNWRANGFLTDDRVKLEVIGLANDVAEPKPVAIAYLNDSKQKELAKQFVEYATSIQGQSIFRSYGYLDLAKKSH